MPVLHPPQKGCLTAEEYADCGPVATIPRLTDELNGHLISKSIIINLEFYFFLSKYLEEKNAVKDEPLGVAF